MALTIGRKHSGRAYGDYAAVCGVCGVPWHRSKMKRNANGILACPDDQKGRVEKEIELAQLRDSMYPHRIRPMDGVAEAKVTIDDETEAIEAAHMGYFTAADEDPYSMDSFTATAGRLYLLSVTSYRGTVGSITDTLTWELVATTSNGGAAGSDGYLSVYRAMPTSTTASAPTVTLDNSGAQAASAIIYATEFSGVTTGSNGASAIVQSTTQAEGAVTSITATLDTFATAGNATFGALGRKAIVSDTISPGDGFTELYSSGAALMLQTQWREGNDTSVDWSWTTAATHALAIAIELEAT